MFMAFARADNFVVVQLLVLSVSHALVSRREGVELEITKLCVIVLAHHLTCFHRLKKVQDYCMSKQSVELELLVKKIQQQLAPKADVLHNVKLEGRRTGAKRQIDVLVREKVGQYDINIIIDCKDYKHPVDVKGVEEFAGLLDDVGAQKGVLVCPVGFTANAKKRAAGLQIDLYSPVDTDAHKWQASPTIPALCNFREAGISFGISTSSPSPFMIPFGFFNNNIIYDEHKNALGTCYGKVVERWNNGELSNQLGITEGINIFGDIPVQTDNGYGQLCPISVYVGIDVREQLFSGQLPILKMSGFKDEMTGKVITNAFSVGLLDPNEIDKNWTPIVSEDELAVKPVIRLQGVVCWYANAGVEIKL
jgi:hypothetical protein